MNTITILLLLLLSSLYNTRINITFGYFEDRGGRFHPRQVSFGFTDKKFSVIHSDYPLDN